MRTYPTNSPHAAARIVALAMLADGHLCKSELDALARTDRLGQLGLTQEELLGVLHTLCEDLLATSDQNWEAACRVDPATFTALLAEIDDSQLRRKVLLLCAAVFSADAHLADGEAAMLEATVKQWALHRDPLAGTPIQQGAQHV